MLKTRFRLRFKIIFFMVFYTAMFYYFRNSDYYNYRHLISSIDAVPWLYSTIGLIFSIISAFIIQKEWQQWNDLVDAVKSENNALYGLWIWSGQLGEQQKIEPLIKHYLQIIIQEGWEKTESGEVSQELDEVIKLLHGVVGEMLRKYPSMSTVMSTTMSDIGTSRERRIRFGSNHMPRVLLSTFRLATALMIFLSPLIAIKTYELHYLFTASIALLSYTVYIVALDLDQPLKPGGWHLTTADYSKLLAKLGAQKNSI